MSRKIDHKTWENSPHQFGRQPGARPGWRFVSVRGYQPKQTATCSNSFFSVTWW